MAYATISDIKERYKVDFDESLCLALLDDAAVSIDAFNKDADMAAKKVVSCNMVKRVLAMDENVPMGTSQGTMSSLGYSQTFTLGSNGSTGELYLSKMDKKMLGASNKIASHSVLEDIR